MAVWCGQCQARNDDDADFCVRCGAPLNVRTRREEPVRLARPTGAEGKATAAPLPKVELHDPAWLVRLIEEQAPDRPDLLALVRRCRVVAGREAIEAGRGARIYFLIDRPGAYFAAPEDTYSFVSSGESITLVVVKDGASPARRAIHFVERKPATLSVPAEIQRAQYELLGREKLALQWQACLGAVVGLLLGFLALLYLTAPPTHVSALLVVAAALAVGAALYVYSLTIRLEDRDMAMARLEAIMGLPLFGDGRGAALGRRGAPAAARVPTPANIAAAVSVALSVVLVWLVARAVLAGGAVTAGETQLVVAVAILLYPIVSLLREARRRLLVGRLRGQAAQAAAEGRPYPFEPWVG